MHRRVAQTVAAVLPQTHVWSGSRQAGRIADEDNLRNDEDYYSRDVADHITAIGQPGAESAYNVNEPYFDYSSCQWRRMDSHGESILSGLSGEDGQERMRKSPESMRRGSSLGRVAEEGQIDAGEEVDVDPDEAVEWELEQNGLYGGSYRRLLAMYTLVPSTALLAFVVLALLPSVAWPSPSPSAPSRYPALFPSPLPELFLSSSMFSLGHLLRVPVFSLSLLLVRPSAASLLSTFLHVLVINTLRLVALALLQVRHSMAYPTPTCDDPAFRTVWWLSLNVAEVAVAVVQGYQQIALYRDVMVPKGREHEFLERTKHVSQQNNNVNGAVPNSWTESPEDESQSNLGETDDPLRRALRQSTDVLDVQIDRDFDKLVAVKSREELEEVYGLPVIKIPVFVSCLQRFNSIILSLGLNLLLSCAYLRSPISIPVSDTDNSNPYPSHWHSPFAVTFPIILVIHTSLASLYTPTILPRIGVHTAAYVGVLVGPDVLLCRVGRVEGLVVKKGHKTEKNVYRGDCRLSASLMVLVVHMYIVVKDVVFWFVCPPPLQCVCMSLAHISVPLKCAFPSLHANANGRHFALVTVKNRHVR
ncbi:hypothetical protein F5I97DRAFT_2068851 [Phlebopus sp. FC_14]|nr:hypothetical protein F5I97DRAFT_2068851 [Phlebopus sp. FC_14]